MPEQPEVNRVTAGLPAVDPMKRFQLECRERTREKQRAAIAEAEIKREAAVAPDASFRPTTSWDAQRGLTLHSSELIRRLSILNPSLWFERHPYISSVMAIYVRGEEGKKFICGFEAEYSPEFEVRLYHEEETAVGWGDDIHLETVKVCDGTIRGWRTVLSRLIKAGLITQPGAERMFGAPTHESRFWKLAIS